MATSTTPAPITRHRPRGLPPVVPSHDPAENAEEASSPAALAAPISATPNNTTGGKPRAYTSTAGIRIHCAYDEIVDVDSLVSHPKNPNVHPAAQIELLAKIITGTGIMEDETEPDGDATNHADGGYREAITLSRRSGFIIKGHGRRGAALLIKQQTGETAVPVVWQDYKNEAEEYADMVADNRIAELSALDVKQVGELIQEIEVAFPDFDVSMFAFSSAEVTAFSGGWEPSRDVTTAGSTDSVGRGTIKVLCPQSEKEAITAILKDALAGREGVEIE